MSPGKTTESLIKLNLVLEDLQMLRDGIWQPDKESVEASIDNLLDIIYNIENE
jgi:hypothetical protein